MQSRDEERIVFLLETRRDADFASAAFRKAGLPFTVVSTLSDACREIEQGAGVVLLTEEALRPSARERLAEVLARQSPWSEIPILLLLSGGVETAAARFSFQLPADVTLLPRPIRLATLLAVIHSALKNRRRQYELRDHIAEREIREEQLQRAKEAAEAASRAKSEFLANMSHEMRTPLAAVMGMIDLVLEMELGEEQRRLLRMAGRSADSLLRLISDVLDFSRIEAGRLEMERRPFDLRRCIETAVDAIRLQARAQGLSLVATVDPLAPETLTADEGRLRQVLVNLLGNAVKFTRRGEVELSVRPEGGGTVLLFSVRDTGIGIPEEKMEHLFDKFTQADASSTRRYGGTGLGLALTRRIVEGMGGRIWAESRPGEGSVFSFTLSLEKAPT